MKIYVLCDNDKLVRAYLRRITAEDKAEEWQKVFDLLGNRGNHYWHVHEVKLEED